MARTVDVIVAGLGAMGSATVYQLAARGKRVLGFDRFCPPHGQGSSHGHARVIREAYPAGSGYVPLVLRAYELWYELERASGEELVKTYGHLSMRRSDDRDARGMVQSAGAFDIPIERIPADEIRRRYPMFRPEEDWEGIYEPRAGAVFPEKCIGAYLKLAEQAGAVLRCDESVLAWNPDGGGVRVTTAKGTFRADRLVITAGAWVDRLVAELGLPVTIERMTIFMFEPVRNAELFTPDRCPNNSWGCGPGPSFYCQPDFGCGFKAALHRGQPGVDPDALVRKTTAKDEGVIRPLVERYIPDAAGRVLESVVCMYTNLPDSRWLIDHHPEHPQVIIGSPCSGHGFKFSAVIGEMLADMALGSASRFDIDVFGIDRLLHPKA